MKNNLNLDQYAALQAATIKQLNNQDDSAAAFIEKINKLLKIKNL